MYLSLQHSVYTLFVDVCQKEELKVQLPSGGKLNWSELRETSEGLGLFVSEAGNVTFNGTTEGSVATYATMLGYFINGEMVVQRRCQNNTWLPSVGITTIS